MYGFQPLWMMLVAGLAQLTADKELLLRLTLTAASLLHVAVGCLLWAWLRRGGREWRGGLAAALWWLNPPLFHLDVSGMEAPLYALLLVLLLGFAWPRLRGEGLRRRWLLLAGVLAGLLVLCRTESLILLSALLVFWLVRARSAAPQRLAAAGTMLAGALLVTAPWGIYAAVELDSVTPISGRVKLTGAPARLARSVTDVLPFLSGPARAILPATEQPIFDAAELETPGPGSLVREGIGGALEWAIGFWLPSSLFHEDRARRDWFLLPLLAVFLALLGRAWLGRKDRDPIPWATGTGVLAAWAMTNLLINGLLLLPYARQQFWHRVPESLLLVVLIAHGIPYCRAALSGWPRLARGAAAYAAGVGLLSAWVFAGVLAPRTLQHEGATNRAAWEMVTWMNSSLPAGRVVGSWHSGFFGYFADGPVVVNLDGLANDRAYLDTVVAGELAYRLGESSDNPTLEYLDAHEIRWLLDTAHPARLGSESFQQVVPPERYVVAREGTEPVSWNLDQPTHVLALVRIE